MADSNDRIDDAMESQKPAHTSAADDGELSAQGEAAPPESESDLDAKLLEAAQRWAEEFNPALGGAEDNADEDLVLGGAAPKPKARAKGKSKKSAKDSVKTQISAFDAAPLNLDDEDAVVAVEPESAVEDSEPSTLKEDVELELLAYGDSLADRIMADDDAISEERADVKVLEAGAEEDIKPKKKSKRASQALVRSGASAVDEASGSDARSIEPDDATAAESIEPDIVTDERQGLMRWDEAINLEAQIEAVLFAAPKPISISEIAETLADDDGNELDHKLIDSIVQQLFRLYNERSGGFRLEYDKGAGYQFRTVPAAAPIMERMFSSRQRPLSRAAHETLAIIAYRQPCTRADIEFIRGVDAGSIIKNLLERDLVACVGRKEDSGRPMLFGTTAEFMRVFRIQSLNDLPPLSAFQPASEAMIDAFQKIERPDLDVDVEDFIGDEGQEHPEISSGLASDFAKSDGVFEVRGDGSESSAPTEAKVRRSGGIFDHEGFLSDGHENTEVALPTRDSLAERSGEDASRGPDQHQRQSGTRTGDEDPT